MQLHNILITNNTSFSTSIHISQNDSVIDLKGGDITERLTDFLSSGQLPRGTSINLVLDQSFIRYQYFSLPLISNRKIHQVLQFELEDTLLKGTENYVFSYSSKSIKKSGITKTGVFIIERQLLKDLITVFRLFSLELRWITSLENLIDLAHHEKGHNPGNSVMVELSEISNTARFFIYQSGFLTGISALSKQQAVIDSTDNSSPHHFSDRLNQKVNAIRLTDPNITEICISGPTNNQIGLKEQQFAIVQGNQTSFQPEKGQTDSSIFETRLDHPRRINLIKSNILIIQELKKYSRSLIITAGILFFSLALYVAAVAYRGYNDHLTIRALEKRTANTISRYLPRGTSKANALNILKERVQSIELEKEKNRKFERRRYQVSRTLTDLSLLKEDIPSLTISRFTLNKQVIRFHGKAASISELDQFQEALIQLYPTDTFRVNTSEKTRGTGSVDFSTTIQRKQKQ